MKNKNKRINKEKIIINALNNKENPYSIYWPNNLLKINYNSNLEIKNFQNGIPQFKIIKLKEEYKLPPLIDNKNYKFHKRGLKYFINSPMNNQSLPEEYKGKTHRNIDKKNNIKFKLIFDFFDKENKHNIKENNTINHESNEVIFNNYDGNYDVRNEKNYDEINKQIEERNFENNNNNGKKKKRYLSQINENDEE